MKLHKLTTAIVALTAAAVLGSSAQAQVTTNYTSGDLLIGFEQAGAANNYVVDLGSASQFIGATTLNFQLSTADLAADFTSNWAVNTNGATNVQWGVVGNDQSKTVQSNANTVWFTEGEVTAGTKNTALTGLSGSQLHTISSNIQNLETASGGFAGSTSTSDTTKAINQSPSAANSWTSFSPGNTAFNLGFSIEQPGSGSNTGPTDSVLDLFEYVPGASSASLLGTFSLAGNGDLTFNANAVPEPSAYALGITALVLFGVLKRRRSMVQS
jgi:hypothetical protein